MFHLRCAAIFSLTLLCTFAAPTWAQELVATDLSEVDEDYHVQGEYVGTIQDQFGNSSRVGLQIVAMGGGEFGGMQYKGGLPGAGWNGKDRFVMQGGRNGNVVVLMSGPHSAVLHKGQVTIGNFSQGLQQGTLKKTHRTSPDLGTPPPPGAIVLFNGTDTGQLVDPKITSDGLLMEGTETVRGFRDFQLHLEFRLPYMPYARGQGRANSGAYLQSRYEVQILDSFGLEGVENECGALYKQLRPSVNMCLPPLVWQSYDINFRSPRFDSDGRKTENARITVRHNGVVIHNNIEIVAKTGAGKPEASSLLPTKFQDHRNPVRFRNMWIVERSYSGSGSSSGTSYQWLAYR